MPHLPKQMASCLGAIAVRNRYWFYSFTRPFFRATGRVSGNFGGIVSRKCLYFWRFWRIFSGTAVVDGRKPFYSYDARIGDRLRYFFHYSRFFYPSMFCLIQGLGLGYIGPLTKRVAD